MASYYRHHDKNKAKARVRVKARYAAGLIKEHRTPEQKVRIRERVKQWRKNNPIRAAAIQSAAKARRRAIEAKASGSHTANEIQAKYEKQNGLCAYCHVPLKGVFAEDHVLALTRGGSNSINNIVCVCKSCNSRKHNMPVDVFLDSIGWQT